MNHRDRQLLKLQPSFRLRMAKLAPYHGIVLDHIWVFSKYLQALPSIPPMTGPATKIRKGWVQPCTLAEPRYSLRLVNQPPEPQPPPCPNLPGEMEKVVRPLLALNAVNHVEHRQDANFPKDSGASFTSKDPGACLIEALEPSEYLISA